MTEKISVKKFLVFGIAIFIFWLVFMPRLAFADCLDRDAFFDFDSFLTGATWMNWQGEINNCVDNRVIVTRDDKGITGLRIWMDRDGRKDKHWIAPIFNTVRFDGREVISSKGEGYHCYDHCPGGPDNVIEFECPDGEFLKGFKFVRVRDGDGYKHGFAFSYKCGTLEGSGGYWQCKPYYMYGDVRDGDSPDMAKHGLEGYCVSHWDALNGGGKDWDDSGTFEIGANKIFTGVAWLYDFWPSGGWSDFFSFNFRYKEATQSVLIHYGGRIGIQLSDDGCSSQFGSTKYTPWASNGGGWSDWASDSNNYDPDCIKLKLEPETFYSQGKDFRICVQLSDKSPGSHSGATKCTPWASDGGGWSDWATDDNREDPDYIRVQLQTRDLPDDKYIKDWRIGIQLSDDGCSSQFGTTKYTPWASDGGGWSFWTTDDYGNDPDCVKVYLGAQVGTVSQVTISGTVRDNNGNPLSGVRLDLCHDMSATTNSNGYWSKIVNKCQPFCVRIDNSSLDSVVPGWTSHTPNYEWQKAGTYCAQSNECECADEEKEHDRPSDSGYDFVVTVPSGKPTVDCTSITCDSNNVVTVDFTVDTKDGVIADYWLQGKIDNASWKDMKPYCPYVASCSPDSVGECCYTYSQSGNIFYYTFKYKGEFGHTYNFRGKINNNAQWSDWAECKEYQCRSQNLTKPSLSCISNTCPNNIVSFKWKANPYGKNIDDFKLDIKEGNKPWQVLLTGVTNQNCYSDCYCPVNSSCYNDFKNNYSPSQGQLAYIYWDVPKGSGESFIFWFKYGGKENTSYKFRGKIKTEDGWSDWAECEDCKREASKCINCSDCGDYFLNTCDRQKCLSCQENCYFIDKPTGGDCLSCRSANSCQDYQNDKTTCQTDPCGFGNCKWENNTCITKSVFQDQRKIKERDIIERTNHGILEEVKNYHGDIQRVLHLWGTHYERGYAHGYLLAKEIPEMFKYTLETDDVRDISLYNQIKTQLLPKYSFKDKYNQELQGIYDGMIQKLKEINRLDLLYIPSLGKDMDLEDLKMHQLILEVLRYKGTAKSCSGLAIWGDYSKNGHTVLAKSTDFGRGSKEQVCKYHLIVTVDPAENDEVEYFALSWPGFLGTFSAGVNRYGIFVSIITGDEILFDIPIVQHLTPNNLIYKEILEEIKSSSKSSFNNIKDIYEAKTLWPVQDLIALPSQGDSNNAIVMEDGFQIGPFIRWSESELHQKAYDAGITNDKFRIISISSNYYLPETVPYGKGFVDPKMYDYIIEKFENAKNKGRIDVDSMYDVYREAHNESNPYYNNGQGVSAIAADLNNMEFLITQCYPGEIGGWYYQIEPIRYKWDDLFYYK